MADNEDDLVDYDEEEVRWSCDPFVAWFDALASEHK